MLPFTMPLGYLFLTHGHMMFYLNLVNDPAGNTTRAMVLDKMCIPLGQPPGFASGFISSLS